MQQDSVVREIDAKRNRSLRVERGEFVEPFLRNSRKPTSDGLNVNPSKYHLPLVFE